MGIRSFVPGTIRISGRGYLTGVWRDTADVLQRRRRPHLVPPARLDTNGVGDYVAVGDAWVRRLREHGLRVDDDVLDVGCGTGRIARGLVGQQRGAYLGVDVFRPAVEWAQKAFAAYTNFRFAHLDVFNDLYNPRGKPISMGFALDSQRRDFAFATSLFSHLDPDVVRIYLREIARVLKGGKQLLSTWYLYDDDTLAMARRRYTLPHDFAFFRRQSLNSPAAIVAYQERWVMDVMRVSGFDSLEVIRGAWRGGTYAGQDVVVSVKRERH